MTQGTETVEVKPSTQKVLAPLELSQLERHRWKVKYAAAQVDLVQAEMDKVAAQMQNQLRQLSQARTKAVADQKAAVDELKAYASETAANHGVGEPIEYDTETGVIAHHEPEETTEE